MLDYILKILIKHLIGCWGKNQWSKSKLKHSQLWRGFLDTLANYEFCFVNVQSVHCCEHDILFYAINLWLPIQKKSEFWFVNLPIVDYFIGFGWYFLRLRFNKAMNYSFAFINFFLLITVIFMFFLLRHVYALWYYIWFSLLIFSVDYSIQ